MAAQGEDDEWHVDWTCAENGVWRRGFKSHYQSEESAHTWGDWRQEPIDSSTNNGDGKFDAERDDNLEVVGQVIEPEATAVDAKRTLSNARKAVADAKKSRCSLSGGKPTGTGKGSSRLRGCLICGSPHHFWRDSPDRYTKGRTQSRAVAQRVAPRAPRARDQA